MQKVSELLEELQAIEARVGTIDDLTNKIEEKRKELAALEGECNVARAAMNDLGSQRVELQNAVNANRALLSKSQADLANATAMFDALRKKVQSLPIRAAS
jgi:predicted  nucleic acid-binding Zn-ribbon protein